MGIVAFFPLAGFVNRHVGQGCSFPHRQTVRRSLTPFLCLLGGLLLQLAVPRHVSAEGLQSAAAESTIAPPSVSEIAWNDEYAPAMAEARSARKMLLLWFYDPHDSVRNDEFEQTVLASQSIADRLGGYVTAKLPTDTNVPDGNRQIALLKHPVFAEMLGGPGLAIIDQRDPESPHFGWVVSVYPFNKGPISGDHLAVLLDLPTGSLTQRTMIFAVRTHPLRPQSAWGQADEMLISETEKQARLQASIQVQGHHQWDQRFHQINARLPGHLVANEVCAESWPGQTLVEAAEDCVDCWRQSSGHWEHVSRRQGLFGFDMKRGRNGIWYATGIFGSRRS